jgi:hypothetical protein
MLAPEFVTGAREKRQLEKKAVLQDLKRRTVLQPQWSWQVSPDIVRYRVAALVSAGINRGTRKY